MTIRTRIRMQPTPTWTIVGHLDWLDKTIAALRRATDSIDTKEHGVIIRTFWVWHIEGEAPDCEAAWGQWMVDENPEGWEAVKQEVLDRYGNGLTPGLAREIEVQIDHDDLMRYWWPDPIDGKVGDT